MIISKTPYRISFFGGGTDYPQWYNKFGGSVISTSINYYSYISVKNLENFYKHKYRILYAKTEQTNNITQINHPSVKEVLKYFKIKNNLEIHHQGDLPSRSGIGSSSSFTNGLINCIYNIKNIKTNKLKIALKSIEIEQNKIRETVGSQDQIATAIGGLNRINFSKNDIKIKKIPISAKNRKIFESHILLVFTEIVRDSFKYSKNIVKNFKFNLKEMEELIMYVDEAYKLLIHKNFSPFEFGKLLSDYWKIKKNLSKNTSNETIDNIYNISIKNGALGGKLLGAGGGGFFLIIADPSAHFKIKKKLSPLVCLNCKFENEGTSIIFRS